MSLDRARLDGRGLEHDRMLMLIDQAGGFLTQRRLPRMALITPAIEKDRLTLRAPGADAIDLPIVRTGVAREVLVWRDTCQAFDQGDAVAKWLSDYLDCPCRLVRMPDAPARPMSEPASWASLSFADAYPLMLLSEESLADLNARLPAPLSMDRFRPNIVVRGGQAFAEDAWREIRLGAVGATIVEPCARCVMTCVDQVHGTLSGREPLRTLASYRKRAEGVIFGQNLVHAHEGVVSVGDLVEVLQ